MSKRIGWWLDLLILVPSTLASASLGTAVWQGWFITDETWVMPLTWFCTGLGVTRLVELLTEGRKRC